MYSRVCEPRGVEFNDFMTSLIDLLVNNKQKNFFCQMISFIDIFLRCAGGQRVLCIVPINTLQNWLAEFNYWLPEKDKLDPDDDLTQHRCFGTYIINDAMKTMAMRANILSKLS